MTAPLYFSRAQLRRDAPIAALKDLLVPHSDDARVQSAHKLVWTLFADSAERRRDFLWREAAPGRFYILSARPPLDTHHLFDLEEAKPFAPALRPGDRLRFALRANPTIAKSSGPGARGRPTDVVMNAIHAHPKGERAQRRAEAIQAAGRAWLERQGARAGFALDPADAPRIDGYRVHSVGRGRGMRIGALDYDGVLRVEAPAAFLAALAQGFGRAKAFGFGLMLIRRA